MMSTSPTGRPAGVELMFPDGPPAAPPTKLLFAFPTTPPPPGYIRYWTGPFEQVDAPDSTPAADIDWLFGVDEAGSEMTSKKIRTIVRQAKDEINERHASKHTKKNQFEIRISVDDANDSTSLFSEGREIYVQIKETATLWELAQCAMTYLAESRAAALGIDRFKVVLIMTRSPTTYGFQYWRPEDVGKGGKKEFLKCYIHEAAGEPILLISARGE